MRNERRISFFGGTILLIYYGSKTKKNMITSQQKFCFVEVL